MHHGAGGDPSRPAYDSKNQLVRHDSVTQNASFTYSYDKAGNITAVKRYAYTTGSLGTALETRSYTYSTTSWQIKSRAAA